MGTSPCSMPRLMATLTIWPSRGSIVTCKLGTHDESTRVNFSLLGMCMVHAWPLYSGARGGAAKLTQGHFYEDLASERSGKNFAGVGLPSRGEPGASEPLPAPCFDGVGIYLTPTQKRRLGQVQ